MGVIKRGILGGFSKKVGPVVGSSWKGIDVIKSKPVSVANPNTPAQQAQRSAMRAANVFLRSFGLDNVKYLNNAMAVRMSGFNRCMKKMNAFKPGNELQGHVKCLASGNFPLPIFQSTLAFSLDEDNKLVTVKWSQVFAGNPQPVGTQAMVTVMGSDGLTCTRAVYGFATTANTNIDCSSLTSVVDCYVGVCYIAEDGLSTSDVVVVQL